VVVNINNGPPTQVERSHISEIESAANEKDNFEKPLAFDI
jgi:hypothetical protein